MLGPEGPKEGRRKRLHTLTTSKTPNWCLCISSRPRACCSWLCLCGGRHNGVNSGVIYHLGWYPVVYLSVRVTEAVGRGQRLCARADVLLRKMGNVLCQVLPVPGAG